VLPHDLIVTAKHLADGASGKPRQSHLRRAVSTAYYALFHAMARSCADLLIGSSGADKSKPAWNQVYRALDHGFAKQACLNQKVIVKFPQEIRNFANAFAKMQVKRHDADYNPDGAFFKSDVLADIAVVEVVLSDFDSTPIKDRRAFAVWVLLKHRT
jgi:uncharacterized protein (UPF0332 family)